MTYTIQNRKALITGGAGFIGSHLAEFWLEHGGRVCIVDNLSTGSRNNMNYLLQKFPSQQIDFIYGSVLDGFSLKKAIPGCDVVFHLASVVGVRCLMRNPQATYRENIQGARQVFSAVLAAGLPLLFASSSEVYGLSCPVPFVEADANVKLLPARSRLLYGRSKLEAELLLQDCTNHFAGSARAVRLFNVIGQRQLPDYGMVVPRFLKQALDGQVLSIFDDGQQKRCFADVREIVACLVKLLPQTPGYDCCNLGSPHAISIFDLAHMIRDYTASTSQICHVDPRSIYGNEFEDWPVRIPDLTHLTELGVEAPKRSVQELLPRLCQKLPTPLFSK